MSVVLAPAKLTLSLRITGVRDDGYHLIDAEMTTLDLHDRLEIGNGNPSTLEFTGPFAQGLVADDRNLVTRALRFVGRSASVVLEKNIPHGGGLGGGSADAAAVLRWAGVDIDRKTVATNLGADVPFCLAGGRARVRGIGEIIEPIEQRPGVVTLIVPPFSVSTPAVYRAWDELGGPRSDGPNDLEPAALVVEPRLADWREAIHRATGVRPVLAGSGATWFVNGDHEQILRTAWHAGQQNETGRNRLDELEGISKAHVIVARHV